MRWIFGWGQAMDDHRPPCIGDLEADTSIIMNIEHEHRNHCWPITTSNHSVSFSVAALAELVQKEPLNSHVHRCSSRLQCHSQCDTHTHTRLPALAKSAILEKHLRSTQKRVSVRDLSIHTHTAHKCGPEWLAFIPSAAAAVCRFYLDYSRHSAILYSRAWGPQLHDASSHECDGRKH